jgi:hypothetical protein
MRIDGNHGVGATPSLRLVKPTDATPAVQPVKRSDPARDGDAISFEAVYVQNLPRTQITEAHRKLDRIRQQLVAGKTDVPIHFNTPARASNPYKPSFLKLSADPGEFNASATQAAAE